MTMAPNLRTIAAQTKSENHMWYFVEAIKSAMKLKRVCPKCGHKQVVKSEHKDRAVICKKCGEKIPRNRT